MLTSWCTIQIDQFSAGLDSASAVDIMLAASNANFKALKPELDKRYVEGRIAAAILHWTLSGLLGSGAAKLGSMKDAAANKLDENSTSA
jgi:hypothetical protein